MNRLREAVESARRAGLPHVLMFNPWMRGIVAANINYAMRVDAAVARVHRVCAALSLDPEPIIQSAGYNPDVLEEEYRRLASGYTP